MLWKKLKCDPHFQVVVSVFGDQPTNGEEAVHKGYGIHIPFETLTSDNLFEAISTILNQPKHTDVARSKGQLLLDQVTQQLTKGIIQIIITVPGSIIS